MKMNENFFFSLPQPTHTSSFITDNTFPKDLEKKNNPYLNVYVLVLLTIKQTNKRWTVASWRSYGRNTTVWSSAVLLLNRQLAHTYTCTPRSSAGAGQTRSRGGLYALDLNALARRRKREREAACWLRDGCWMHGPGRFRFAGFFDWKEGKMCNEEVC